MSASKFVAAVALATVAVTLTMVSAARSVICPRIFGRRLIWLCGVYAPGDLSGLVQLGLADFRTPVCSRTLWLCWWCPSKRQLASPVRSAVDREGR